MIEPSAVAGTDNQGTNGHAGTSLRQRHHNWLSNTVTAVQAGCTVTRPNRPGSGYRLSYPPFADRDLHDRSNFYNPYDASVYTLRRRAAGVEWNPQFGY
jgi:hypothetical protein